MGNYYGKGTINLDNAPSVLSYASAVGPKEGKGPLADYFDYIGEEAALGEDGSWEKAEVVLQKNAFRTALEKGRLAETDISFIFAGDLLNQCTCSSYGGRDFDIPFIGLFGACSTMAESLALASVFVEAGVAQNAAAMTSSHFCSAERQFRFPLNYGGQRTPTAQWTATAAGCVVVAPRKNPPYIKAVTFGKVTDMGVKDVNNIRYTHICHKHTSVRASLRLLLFRQKRPVILQIMVVYINPPHKQGQQVSFLVLVRQVPQIARVFKNRTELVNVFIRQYI
ncbi:MAG: stage V sporulation protein AD [Oscillospiraceae bacterium]|nr:stage V sporulation protein AD [Oscillospiraceae bacterium]